MPRSDNRASNQLRPVEITRGFTESAGGSVLIRAGRTMVLCTASWVEGVPPWKESLGGGWVTAEYDMLPASTSTRRQRNRTRVDGRTQEIQRLIGRSMRAIVDLETLGPNSIYIDCDVLQADGGTRTAAVTGAYVALVDAVRSATGSGALATSPVREPIAAVSVGIIGGEVLLDLDYREDVAAEVDMNVVMTQSGRFVEVQGTGEGTTFSREELGKLLDAAAGGIARLIEIQEETLASR